MELWLAGVILASLLSFAQMANVPQRREDDEERPKLPTADEIFAGQDIDSLTGWDRFSYGQFALADGISGMFRKVEGNVIGAIKFYEGILNFIHDTVHIHNDTVDFHEAAYITGPTKAPDAQLRRQLLRLRTTKPPRI